MDDPADDEARANMLRAAAYARVFHDGGAWLSQTNGISLPLAALTDPGAHDNLGLQLAYKNGQVAFDYFVEYARPTEWNRGPSGGTVFIRRIGPGKDVGPTPAILGSITVPATVGVPASFLEPTGSVLFEVQRFDPEGRIVKVTAGKHESGVQPFAHLAGSNEPRSIRRR